MKHTNSILADGGFHHVAIRVRDFEATVRFYCDVLGFRERIRWGEAPKLACMLDTGDGNYLEVFSGGSDEPKPEGAFIHVAFRTRDCRAAIERVREAGMEITMEPKELTIQSDPPTPVCIAFFKGPDGEVIELFQNELT
ncbi:MAG: VOC family protein [Phycisphaeraceae bacterium]|nr:VOC family protein [Phycisphaeraceae bacterium]